MLSENKREQGEPRDPHCRWQHPWLRLEMLLKSIRSTTWDGDTWPQAKAALSWALREGGRLVRVGWSS